ncbi:Tub family-domain-containing protein [Chytriomyces sp. MP71]|nr:Tub family-domain-containing protein [Chytriomyces sp. MP71]
MKAVKRELKEWEHCFISQNGRKPDKKDIAADREIAKKYKAYAKMKQDAEGQAFEGETEISKTNTARGAAPASESRVQPFRTSSLQIQESCDAMEGEAESSQPFKSKSKSRHTIPLRETSFPSTETIVDQDDLEAQQFFNQIQTSPREPMLANSSTPKTASTNPLSVRYSITKEDLYASTSFQNVSSSFGTMTQAGSGLPQNFKMRKSTIAAGPIATNDAFQVDPNTYREEEQDSFFRSELEEPTYTLKTYSEGCANAVVKPTPEYRPQSAEVQDFIYRRQQLEQRQSITTLTEEQRKDAESTPSDRHAAPCPQPPVTRMHSLGNRVTTASVTQIRVITPTRDTRTDASPSPSSYSSFLQKSPKRGLDLPIPGPPIVVKVDDIESVHSSQDEEEADVQSDGSCEDQTAVMVSSKVGSAKQTKGVIVLEGKQKKAPKPVELPSEDVKIRKLPDNSFFSLEGDDVEEVEVEPFYAAASSTKTLEVEKPDEIAPVLSKKGERIVDAAIKDKEKEDSSVEVTPVSSNSAKPTSVTIAQPPPVFMSNPKVFSRIPQDGSVLKCRLTRKKTLWDKAHPTFYLYNEVDDKFLLAARKRIKSKTVNYLISTSMDDLSKDSTHYVAKLKANFQRTNFILYDARFYNKNANNKGLKEMACITYSKTVLPREMSLAVHAPAIEENSDEATKDIMADIKSHNTEKLLFLKNKPPRWNETTQSHCLNFGGRVTQPSIKNFQLIGEDSDMIILQFGRCGPDLFSLDARFPLTPIEAFAVAITTFDAYDSA